MALFAGPKLALSRFDLSLVATGFRRWYGTRLFNEGVGGRIEVTHYPSARTALFFGLSAQQVRYPRSPLQSGPILAARGGAVRALTPSSSLTFRF